MKSLIFIAFLLLSTSIFAQSNLNAVVSSFEISLKNEDHNSEGFVDMFDNGIMINVFRRDTGVTGNHVGNKGEVVRRFSFDGGLTWTIPEVIYSDFFDDRNVSGGVVSGDRVIVFFRRYHAPAQQHIDLNMMISEDGGYTWEHQLINNTKTLVTFSTKISKVDDDGYYMSFFYINYCELRFSPNGLNWDSVVYVWDYTQNEILFSETSFEYVGNGCIIGIFRNETLVGRKNFFQVHSCDYGKTWSSIEHTNIVENFWSPSPSIYYDKEKDLLWVITVDRREYMSLLNNESSVWIYATNPLDLFDNPNNHVLIEKLPRPTPNFLRTYGYFTITKNLEGNLFVIGTECAKRFNNNEYAWLYQFTISYEELADINAYGNEQLEVRVSPNPFTDYINIENLGNLESDLIVIIYDESGAMVFERLYNRYSVDNNRIEINITDLSQGFYTLQLHYNNTYTAKKLIKI